MKKRIGMAVVLLAVMGMIMAAAAFVLLHKNSTRVEQSHEAIKQETIENEGKAYASRYKMQVSLDTKKKVLSGTVCATIKNATDENLNRICVRNWAAAILKGTTLKTEIFSAKIGEKNLQITKKEDASVLYLSDANRLLVLAALPMSYFLFGQRFQSRKTVLVMFALMGTKCISFRFAFQAFLCIKREVGMKIHI